MAKAHDPIPECEQIALRKLTADPFLKRYFPVMERRQARFAARKAELAAGSAGSLKDFASGHEYFGMHRDPDGGGWVFREWAPNATKIVLIGDFSDWRESAAYTLTRLEDGNGVWELKLDRSQLRDGMLYRLKVYFPGGCGERLSAYARYVVQDPQTNIFSCQIYQPEIPYCFQHASPPAPRYQLIYEAHIGMAQEQEAIGTFREFREQVLPRIATSGYNTVQLMAIMSHPYYGSFGYHVANFFSISSRFGTPDEFKELVDAAHSLGLRVIIDLVHSHAVRNEVEGLGCFDGTRTQYFHDGARGVHEAWDSYCFDYGKNEVLHFLLSNCRFYLDEYHVDGFRFDGVTSMLYLHHGLGKSFVSYEDYFSNEVDEDAYTYLALANFVIHQVRPDAITVAEDVSGMPGLGTAGELGGCGFDYRMAMGVTDTWFKLFDRSDESWDMNTLYYELTNRRLDERTISYVECHDQSIVGGQTAIFRLIGRDMYDKMRRCDTSLAVERGVALDKLARLITAATGAFGYLNFMGNEFGHPEWVDFPREGNHWSLHYARRQWSLADNPELFYQALGECDRDGLFLLRKYSAWEYRLRTLKINNLDKVIAFERGNLWFFFNFHPTKSYTNYGVEVMPGSYQLLLNTDSEKYGGLGRVAEPQRYLTVPEQDGTLLRHELKLYLPSRTALVLSKCSQEYAEDFVATRDTRK